MNKEELLKPRYKVIADYPMMTLFDGLIINKTFFPKEKHGTYFYNGHDVTKYPHLFKPLQWWEDRDFDLTGMYVRFGDLNKQHACYKLIERIDYPYMELWRMTSSSNYDHEYPINGSIPITEAEYLDYLTQQK